MYMPWTAPIQCGGATESKGVQPGTDQGGSVAVAQVLGNTLCERRQVVKVQL